MTCNLGRSEPAIRVAVGMGLIGEPGAMIAQADERSGRVLKNREGAR